jgi:phosphatidylglycerophosphate synthase
MRLMTLPNSLSFSRFVLAPVAAWALIEDRTALTVLAFVLAIASDILDGRVARARQQTTRLGTLIDHGADATFVTIMLAGAALLGLVPGILPLLIAAAFLQYALDSGLPTGAPLRSSTLGRINGVGYFILAGVVIAVRHFPVFGFLTETLRAAAWCLVVTTLLSIATRARYTWQVRTQR